MLYPTIDDVRNLLNDYPVVPVFYEVLADTFTPIHIFDALRGDEETCFILESVDNRSLYIGYTGGREEAVKIAESVRMIRA